LHGRIDNVFSVGHEKVAPEEVEAFIAKLAGVEEVVVGQLPDTLLDSVPVALVVSSCDASAMRAEILDQCRQKLSPAKIPRSIMFVKEIPKTHYGKIDRKAAQSLMEGHIGKSNE
jgi:fatty-acyl-CoA synthase